MRAAGRRTRATHTHTHTNNDQLLFLSYQALVDDDDELCCCCNESKTEEVRSDYDSYQ